MRCPTCGADIPDTSKFCSECGAMMAGQPAGAPDGKSEDLRIITAVFSDLSGYTAMSEHLGPEATKTITTRIFSEAAAIAKRFGGRLDRLVGDCALILFGIPRLHEDDPVRALKTAIEIHAFVDSLNSEELVSRIGRSLAMHTGVNTGTVLAGPTNLEAGSESAVGDAMNLASRLKDVAKAGQIYVGAETYRLTAPLFDYEALPPLKLKGKADPVTVHRLQGLKAGPTRLLRSALQGIRSPLVGRNEAVAALSRCLRGLGQGRGGIVFVLGEAGLGKSRLMADVWQQIRADQIGLEYLEGHSLSYGQAISYWPFQEMVKGLTGIQEQDSEQEAWRHLEGYVSRIFNEETDEILPYLAFLLAMELKGPYAERVGQLDGEVAGRRVYLTARRFFLKITEKQPLVLVFEDLHWIDESSALLLQHLLPMVERTPMLICCLSRPDPGSVADHLREAAAKNHSAFYTEIRLAPLSRADSERLVSNLMKNLGSHIREQIVDKAEGNPFFVEEITRALIGSGGVVWDLEAGHWKATERIESVVIPDSVQGVIMSRVDRLSEAVKNVLRTASVIGRSFLYSVLRRITEEERSLAELDGCLAELQEVEFIRTKQEQPELEYVFTHALAREAIYQSILQQRRRDLHTRVGQAIETLFADRVEEFYGLLAYHYAQAESWEKARRYLLLSGDRADRIAADSEALALYRQAMAVYRHDFGGEWDPLQRAMVERKMGDAFARRGEHSLALDHFMQALGHLGKPMPASHRGIRLAILAEALIQAGHRLASRRFVGRSRGQDQQAMQEEAHTYESISWVLAPSDPELALLGVLRLLNSSERTGFLPGLVLGYSFLVYFADTASLLSIADYYARKLLSIIGQVQASGAVGQAHALLGIHENTRARWNKVREHARLAIEAYRRGGYWNIRGWRMAIMDFADADIHEGNFSQALAHAQDLISLGQDSGDRFVWGWGLARQGYAQKGLGKLADSIASLNTAMELLKSVPEYFTYVDCGGELGQCYLRLGDITRALSVFEECRLLRKEHNLLRSPTCTRFINGLAEAYLLLAEQGGASGKAEWLKKAGDACTEALKQGKAYLPGIPEAMMLRGRYEWLRGRPAAAEKWWRQSLELAERTGVRYDLARTHLEIGRRTGEPRQTERAEILLAEMGAEWDLTRIREE
jgi:class 3 adenylate cyclase/tetratricopeptide (TPR) repeat protein